MSKFHSNVLEEMCGLWEELQDRVERGEPTIAHCDRIIQLAHGELPPGLLQKTILNVAFNEIDRLYDHGVLLRRYEAYGEPLACEPHRTTNRPSVLRDELWAAREVLQGIFVDASNSVVTQLQRAMKMDLYGCEFSSSQEKHRGDDGDLVAC